MFERLADTLELWGEIIAEEYKETLQREGINVSHKLSDSVKCLPVDVNGNIYEVSLQLEEYWKAVEYGRKPTQNNGDGQLRRNILEWIKVKPVLPTPYDGKLPTEEQLAYLISRKIHKFGYEGKQPMKKTLEANMNEMFADIEKALSEDLSEDVVRVLRTIVL